MNRKFLTALFATVLVGPVATAGSPPQEAPPGVWDEVSGLLALRWSPGEGHRVRRTTKKVDDEEFGQGAAKEKTKTRGVEERIIEYSDISPKGPGRVTIYTVREESETRRDNGTLVDQFRSALHGRRVTLVRQGGELKLKGEGHLEEGTRSFLEGEGDWPASFFPNVPVRQGATWTLKGETLKKALGLVEMTHGEATMTFNEIVKRGDRECAVLSGRMKYGSRDEYGVSEVAQTVEFVVSIRHGYPLSEIWTGTDRTESKELKETYLTTWKSEVTGVLEPTDRPRAISAAETFARIEGRIRNAPTIRAVIETSIDAGKAEKATLELFLKVGNKMRLEVMDEEEGEKKLAMVSDGKRMRASSFRPATLEVAPLGLRWLVSFSLGRTGLLSGWMTGVPTRIDPDDPFPPTLEHEFRVDDVRYGKEGSEGGVLTYTLTPRASRSTTFDVSIEYDPESLMLRKRTIRPKGEKGVRFSSTEIFRKLELGPDLPDKLFSPEK